MNKRDTDLMTIYAHLRTTKSQSTYLQMKSAFKRIEGYVRCSDPDDYDEFLQQNNWQIEYEKSYGKFLQQNKGRK